MYVDDVICVYVIMCLYQYLCECIPDDIMSSVNIFADDTKSFKDVQKVSCVWVCCAFSLRKCDKQIDYAPIMAKYGGELRESFDVRAKQHLTATHCDTAVASAS